MTGTEPTTPKPNPATCDQRAMSYSARPNDAMSTTAMNGKRPCDQGRSRLVRRRDQQHQRGRSHRPDAGENQRRTNGPVPMQREGHADAGDNGQEQVVEALIERQHLGGLGFSGVVPNVARVRGDVQVSDSIMKM